MPERREFAFIRKITQQQQFKHPHVKHGIGDDAAVLSGITSSEELVVTTDTLMDGVDFMLAECGYYKAGRKSLAVNLSDIAAMAAMPVAAFVSLVLPKNSSLTDAEDFMQGVYALAQEFKLQVAGGDTNSWHGPLVASITIIGKNLLDQSILRSTAKPGDLIAVSGTLGGSILGHHLDFTPRIDLAQIIVNNLRLTSLIDLSDGLSGDLQHILHASKTGARLFANQIPVSPAASLLRDNQTPLEHALHDGEDFELLFTFPSEQLELFHQLRSPVKLSIIGHLTQAFERCLHPVVLCDYLLEMPGGEILPMEVKSWTH